MHSLRGPQPCVRQTLTAHMSVVPCVSSVAKCSGNSGIVFIFADNSSPSPNIQSSVDRVYGRHVDSDVESLNTSIRVCFCEVDVF